MSELNRKTSELNRAYSEILLIRLCEQQQKKGEEENRIKHPLESEEKSKQTNKQNK